MEAISPVELRSLELRVHDLEAILRLPSPNLPSAPPTDRETSSPTQNRGHVDYDTPVLRVSRGYRSRDVSEERNIVNDEDITSKKRRKKKKKKKKSTTTATVVVENTRRSQFDRSTGGNIARTARSRSSTPTPAFSTTTTATATTTTRSATASPTQIPWAAMTSRDLTSSEATSPAVFAESRRATLSHSESADPNSRPLLLAKKLYGHLVNLQGSYADLQAENEQYGSLLARSRVSCKRTEDRLRERDEENRTLEARFNALRGETTRKNMLAQTAVKNVIHAHQSLLLSKVFKAWRTTAKSCKNYRMRQERYENARERRAKKIVFQTLHHFSEASKRKSHRLEHLVKYTETRRRSKAFSLWTSKMVTHQSHAARRGKSCVKILQKLKTRKLISSVTKWKHVTHFGRRVAGVILHFEAHRRVRTFRSCIFEWTLFVRERKFLRTTVAKNFQRKNVKNKSGFFRHWKAVVTMVNTYSWEDEVSKLEKVIADKDEKIVELEDFRDKLFRKNQDKAIKVLNRILHSQLALAFGMWNETIAEYRRQEFVKVRFIQKWKYKPCVAALINWKELVITRVRVRKLLARATTEKSFQWKSRAMNSWKEYVKNFDYNFLQISVANLEEQVAQRDDQITNLQTDLSELVAFRDQIFNRDRHKAVKVLNRICHAQLYAAMTIWSNMVAETNRLEALKNRFVFKWKHSGCASALVTWKSFVATRKKLRHILQRACSDYKLKKKSAAINSWKAYVKAFDADSLKTQVTNLTLINKQQNAELKELRREINSMQDAVDGLFYDRRRRAMAIMSKIVNHQKFTAFRFWSDSVQILKQNEFVVRKFLARMMLGSCAKCVLKWREVVSDRKKMRNFVKKFLLSKDLRLKSVALRTWVSKSKKLTEKDSARHIKLLEKELRGQKAEADNLTAALKETEDLVVKLQQEKIGVLKRNMQKFINMWQHKALHSTYVAWSGWVKTSKTEKVLMARFLKKLLNRTLLKYYNCWHEFHMNEKRNRFILHKFGMRMKNALTTRCLESWKHWTIKRKIENMEERTNEQKVQGVLARMIKGSMVRTFLLWRENVAEIVRNRYVVGKFVRRMQLGGALRAVGRWKELVATRKKMRSFIGKMIGGKRLMLLGAGFNSWRVFASGVEAGCLERAVCELEDIVSEQSEKMKAQMDQIAELEEHIRKAMGVQTEKAIRVIHKMVNVRLNSAFMSWVDLVDKIKRDESIVVKIAARIRYRGVSMSLTRWKELVSTRKWLRRFCVRMVGGTRIKWLSMGMEKWKQGVNSCEKEDAENRVNELIEELEEINERFSASQETLEMYEARYATELRAKRGRTMHVMVRLMHGKMLPAFACWKEGVDKVKRDEELLKKFVKKMYLRGAVKAIACWKEVVGERKFLRRFMNRMLGGRDLALKSAAIRTWCDSVRGYKEGEEKVVIGKMELALENQSEEIDSLNSEIEFLRNQIEALNSEKMAANMKAMKKFIEMWNGKNLYKCFNGWKTWVKEIENTRRILARTVLKWQNKLIERVWVEWRVWHVAEVKERRLRRMKEEKEGEWQNFLRHSRGVGATEEDNSENSSRRINTNFDEDSYKRGGVRRVDSPTGSRTGDLKQISPQSIRNMNSSDLQIELRKRGLPANGSRAAMIARLTACQDFLSPRTVMIKSKIRSDAGLANNIEDSIRGFAEGLSGRRNSVDKEMLAKRRETLW